MDIFLVLFIIIIIGLKVYGHDGSGFVARGGAAGSRCED